MDYKDFENLCKNAVYTYILGKADDVKNVKIKQDEIYVVWMCKTLQNNKALLSTPLDDGMYYECTYDGDKGVLYLDSYKKVENQVFEVI